MIGTYRLRTSRARHLHNKDAEAPPTDSAPFARTWGDFLIAFAFFGLSQIGTASKLLPIKTGDVIHHTRPLGTTTAVTKRQTGSEGNQTVEASGQAGGSRSPSGSES